jgi:hypothetical protein
MKRWPVTWSAELAGYVLLAVALLIMLLADWIAT